MILYKITFFLRSTRNFDKIDNRCYYVLMSTNVLKVGMREFRAHLPQYLLTAVPVAITRHHVEQAELDTLKHAAMALEKRRVSHGVTEDELFQEFRALREGKE